MRLDPSLALPLALLIALGACSGGEGESAAGLPGSADTEPFAAISPGERLHFTGTEPFWGGEAQGGRLRYTTPENIDGAEIAVERFAGRGGLSLSGTLDGRAFDMAVTEGDCSDGMSDRTYPFTVTLQLGEELRRGCGWTERRPFEGPAAP